MSYRNERLNDGFRSLDEMLVGFNDHSKAKFLSDRGRSAARMVRALDYDPQVEARREATREEKLFEAELRLAEAGKGYLIRVLLLIVENGKNREESIAKVPRATYFRHRDELLLFFGVGNGEASPRKGKEARFAGHGRRHGKWRRKALNADLNVAIPFGMEGGTTKH